MISPAFQDLPDGSAVTLSAVIVTGSSVSPVATVSWSSDATDVVSVDGQGRARALALGKATIRATSERMSATREMRVVPDYSGTWKGTYRVTSCRQSSIQGPSYCRFAVGAVFPIAVSLTHTAWSLSGTLERFSTGGALIESGPITGTISEANGLAISGTSASLDAEQPGSTTVAEWQTALVGNDDMQGRFVNLRHFRNSFGWQDSREECEIVTLRR